MKLALSSPPSMQCRTAVWPTCKKYLKNSTFVGGVGVVGVNCSVLWSYPFKDNVYTICCRLLVVSPPPFPPPLNAHALPILPQWATTMQVLVGIVRPKDLTLPATPHFVPMFCSPDRLCISLYSYSATGDFSHSVKQNNKKQYQF